MSVTSDSDITGIGGSGGGVWGTITGTLSDQTDLQAALDALSFTVVSISSNTAAVRNRIYNCDTSGAGFTLTLPSHVAGQIIYAKDSKGTFATNNLTVARNGGTGKIEGLSSSYIISSDWNLTGFFDNGTDWFLF